MNTHEEVEQAGMFLAEAFMQADAVIPSYLTWDVRLVNDPARSMPTPTVELHVHQGARMHRVEWAASLIAHTHHSGWRELIVRGLDEAVTRSCRSERWR